MSVDPVDLCVADVNPTYFFLSPLATGTMQLMKQAGRFEPCVNTTLVLTFIYNDVI